MIRSGNYSGKIGISSGGATNWHDARFLDMEVLERLPAQVQAALRSNNTNLSAVSVLRFYEQASMRRGAQAAIGETIRKVEELEANELAVVAGEFKAAWRLPLPHVAAQVSILRYGSARAKRRGRRMPRIRGFGLADTEAA